MLPMNNQTLPNTNKPNITNEQPIKRYQKTTNQTLPKTNQSNITKNQPIKRYQ
jgi:hypothetical protein